MELVSGMMDGSLSYELEHRREPIVSGAGVEREGNLELTDVPLFEGCSERQLRRIGGIARVFEAPTGTVITRVGEPGNEFYLILDGTVSVDLSVGKPVVLRPGEFFGEMSLLDGGPRSATVVADTPIRLLVISRRHFSGLLKDVPGLTPTLLVTLSKRVRQAEERAERLASASAGL